MRASPPLVLTVSNRSTMPCIYADDQSAAQKSFKPLGSVGMAWTIPT
jgi:hypothetical protein